MSMTSPADKGLAHSESSSNHGCMDESMKQMLGFTATD